MREDKLLRRIAVEERVGSLIRTLRKERNISAEVLASRAGVAPSTLYRWEKGETVPRVFELCRVLDALYVSPEQRHQAMLLLSSPQATAQLRAETTLVIPVVEEWASCVPGTGDLLRAMRVRRNMTGKQLAERLRISQSTVTRWEQSQTAPPLDLLDALFTLLKALPEERAFLSDRRILLNTPLRATSSSLADCEDLLHALHNQVGMVASLPADLMFLVIESQLWPLAGTNTTALRLLALAYTYHANYLMWRERLPEMIAFVVRAETILDRFHHPVTFYLMPIGLSAHYAWQTSRRHGARKALRIFSEAAELATTSSSSVSFYRTMGEYAAAAGFRALGERERPDQLQLRAGADGGAGRAGERADANPREQLADCGDGECARAVHHGDAQR